MRKVSLVLALAAVACFASDAMAGGSDRGCSSCHQPHLSGKLSDPSTLNVPLWSNKYNSDALPVYDVYSGSKKFQSLGITIGQPDGASKLCLGCHDGSYDHGTHEAFNDANDLPRAHPISFVFDGALATASGGTLYDPTVKVSGLTTAGTIDDDMLDGDHKVQCVSCHEPHNNGIWVDANMIDDPENPTGPQIPEKGTGTKHMKFAKHVDLCKTCHNK